MDIIMPDFSEIPLMIKKKYWTVLLSCLKKRKQFLAYFCDLIYKSSNKIKLSYKAAIWAWKLTTFKNNFTEAVKKSFSRIYHLTGLQKV